MTLDRIRSVQNTRLVLVHESSERYEQSTIRLT